MHGRVIYYKLIYKDFNLTLAHKKKGIRPLAMSFEIASESTSGESAKFVEESVLSNLQSSGSSPPICQ